MDRCRLCGSEKLQKRQQSLLGSALNRILVGFGSYMGTQMKKRGTVVPQKTFDEILELVDRSKRRPTKMLLELLKPHRGMPYYDELEMIVRVACHLRFDKKKR